MDYTTCYCRSRQCSIFGKMGSLAQLKLHDWQRGGPRFRCQVCGAIVSVSTGTAYTGVRTDLEIYRRGVKALVEGLSIRATLRLVEVDKDTVNHWLPIFWTSCSRSDELLFPQFAFGRMSVGRVMDIYLQKRTTVDHVGEVSRNIRLCLDLNRLQSRLQISACMGVRKTHLTSCSQARFWAKIGFRRADSVLDQRRTTSLCKCASGSLRRTSATIAQWHARTFS